MTGAIEVQTCSRCRSDAIVFQEYSGQHLCGRHLSSSIRKRTSRELRAQLDLPKNATKDDGSPFIILIAVSGGKDSAVLLSMMADIIGGRRDVELVAGCVDEGIDAGLDCYAVPDVGGPAAAGLGRALPLGGKCAALDVAPGHLSPCLLYTSPSPRD